MATNLLTASYIARRAVLQTMNQSVFLGAVSRDASTEFDRYKSGDTITVPRPVRYLSFDGATLGSQDHVEPSVSLVLNYRKHVPMQFTTKELTLEMEEFEERHIKPATQRLANDIDLAIAQAFVHEVGNSTGTPGTYPSTLLSVMLGKAKLMDFATPVNDRSKLHTVVDPYTQAYLIDGLKGILNSNITSGIVRAGELGEVGGFMLGADQNIVRHTVGAYNGTPLVDDPGGAIADGDTTIPMDGGSGSVSDYFLKGDVITFDGVNSVNPVSKQSTGRLMQFVVTADFDTTSGEGNIPISPAIYASGPQQNVSALPADGAAISVKGTAGATYTQNVQFYTPAVLLASVPLEMPDVPFKARVSMDGISMRLVRDYTIGTDINVTRLDIMFGVKIAYPEHCNRLWGN